MPSATRTGLLMFILLLLWIAPAGGQEDFEWLNSISPEHTLVVGELAEKKLVVFQKSAISRVSGSTVTLKQGAFALMGVVVTPPPVKLSFAGAVHFALINLWAEWERTRPAKEEFTEKREIAGVACEITGRAVTAGGSTTVELHDVLQTGLPGPQ